MTSGDAVGRGLLLASLPPGRTGPLAGPTCQQQQCWRGPWRLATCQAQAEPGGQAWGSGEVTRFLGAASTGEWETRQKQMQSPQQLAGPGVPPRRPSGGRSRMWGGACPGVVPPGVGEPGAM